MSNGTQEVLTYITPAIIHAIIIYPIYTLLQKTKVHCSTPKFLYELAFYELGFYELAFYELAFYELGFMNWFCELPFTNWVSMNWVFRMQKMHK